MSQGVAHQDDFDRIADPDIGRALRDIHTSQQELIGRFDNIEDRLVQAEVEVSSLRSAFPGGDVEGHRRYHDTMIQMLEERRRLRIAIQEKTLSGLLWASLVFLGIAVWNYITKGPR